MASPSWSAPLSTDKYDAEIKKWVSIYWGGYDDWLMLKAQLYQESKLEPEAISYVGAAGVGQFMPGTWLEVSRKLGFGEVSPHVAKYAIQASAYYMMQQRAAWEMIQDPERHRHAQASYNAGRGNISRAWRLCAQPKIWNVTKMCLPQITGRHAQETITYVDRIQYWRDQLGKSK